MSARPSLPRGTALYLSLLSLAALLLRTLGAGANPHYQYDEAYYVAVAQTWLGLRPGPGAVYPHAAIHTDPNALAAPPLGKMLIAGAIHVLGNAPWVWRLPGALAGASLPVTTWWLARSLFPDRPRVAWGAAFVVTLSGLGLSLSRVGLLDSTAVPCVALGLAAAVAAVRTPRFRWGYWGLATAALGVACAIKWTGAQGVALALLTLLGVAGVARRQHRAPPPVPAAVGAMVGGGALIYLASYLLTIPWRVHWLVRVLALQWRMLHALWTLRFHNPALASPWTWWLFPHPVRLTVHLTATTATQLLVMPNPVVMIAALAGGAWAVWEIAHRAAPAAPWAWLGASGLIFWAFWLVPQHPSFVYYAYPLVPPTAIAAVAGWDQLSRTARQVALDTWVLSLVWCLPLWIGLALPRVWAGLIALPWR